MEPSDINIVNFLADGHTSLQWSVPTLENYCSSILDMFQNHVQTRESWAHQAFFQAINDQTIHEDQSRPINIAPIITNIRNLGSNQSMSLSDLIAKLCCLLAVCGCLQPSDIERIDLASSDWTSNPKSLCLRIVALKEKPLGQRIHKTAQIQRHPEADLCTVGTFVAHHQRHAHRPLYFPSPSASTYQH
jgi:hypothetical protein